ncbi:hypothetical protein JMJ35_004848 [Cladonia borealis]|uniref:Spo12 n=1 Tax=Cladonia borealis TaxID=184061 RepID=A0AA39UAW7_9LECA|nr:hypothetical protein JMJ35_004848 [Cladonia borealis]
MSTPTPTPTSPTKPLSTRDINTSSPTKAQTENKDGVEKPMKSMDYHRQVLQNRLAEDGGKQVYVSPSDAVLSPCTQKLSAYKGKSFMKAKPQSLFAKMGAGKKSEGLSGKADEGKGVGNEGGP